MNKLNNILDNSKQENVKYDIATERKVEELKKEYIKKLLDKWEECKHNYPEE